MKFNGTRAWIADNHFENINGNAVLAGYTSEVSGHGDTISSSAATPSCAGWTPISVWSTSGLGGNILIRDNRITETREAAIAIRGCDGVTVTNNEFGSSTPPKQGAWITVEATRNLHTAGNKHTGGIPKMTPLNRSIH